MDLGVEQSVPDVLLVWTGDRDAKCAAQVHRFGGVEERSDCGTSGDCRLRRGGLEGASDTGQIVEGADVDVGPAVDRPRAEGGTQHLSQAPQVVAEYIPQVAKDGELGVVLTDVVVNERR